MKYALKRTKVPLRGDMEPSDKTINGSNLQSTKQSECKINVERLRDLIHDGKQLIDKMIDKCLENLKSDQKCDYLRKIIFLGTTGAGKSSLFSALTDKVYIIYDKEEQKYILGDETQLAEMTRKSQPNETKQQTTNETDQQVSLSEAPKQRIIHNGSVSGTKLPNIRLHHNKLYLDCPGFLDTNGIEQEIYNILLIDYVLSKAAEQSKVKILIVVQIDETESLRGQGIGKTFSLLCKMFPNIKLMKESVGLVFTKTDGSQNCQAILNTFKDGIGLEEQFFKFFSASAVKQENKQRQVFQLPKPVDPQSCTTQENNDESYAEEDDEECKEDQNKGKRHGQEYTFKDKPLLRTYLNDNYIHSTPEHYPVLPDGISTELSNIRSAQFEKLLQILKTFYQQTKKELDKIKKEEELDRWIRFLSQQKGVQLQSLQHFISIFEPQFQNQNEQAENTNIFETEYKEQLQQIDAFIQFTKNFSVYTVDQEFPRVQNSFSEFINTSFEDLYQRKQLLIRDLLDGNRKQLYGELESILKNVQQNIANIIDNNDISTKEKNNIIEKMCSLYQELKNKHPQRITQLIQQHNMLCEKQDIDMLVSKDIYEQLEHQFNNFKDKLVYIDLSHFETKISQEKGKLKKMKEDLRNQIEELRIVINKQNALCDQLKKSIETIEKKEKKKKKQNDDTSEQKQQIQYEYESQADLLQHHLDQLNSIQRIEGEKIQRQKEIISQLEGELAQCKECNREQDELLGINNKCLGGIQIAIEEFIQKIIEELDKSKDILKGIIQQELEAERIRKEQETRKAYVQKFISRMDQYFDKLKTFYKASTKIRDTRKWLTIIKDIDDKMNEYARMGKIFSLDDMVNTYQIVKGEFQELKYDDNARTIDKYLAGNDMLSMDKLSLEEQGKLSIKSLLYQAQQDIEGILKRQKIQRNNNKKCAYREVQYQWRILNQTEFRTLVEFTTRAQYYVRDDEDEEWKYKGQYGWIHEQKYDNPIRGGIEYFEYWGLYYHEDYFAEADRKDKGRKLSGRYSALIDEGEHLGKFV